MAKSRPVASGQGKDFHRDDSAPPARRRIVNELWGSHHCHLGTTCCPGSDSCCRPSAFCLPATLVFFAVREPGAGRLEPRTGAGRGRRARASRDDPPASRSTSPSAPGSTGVELRIRENQDERNTLTLLETLASTSAVKIESMEERTSPRPRALPGDAGRGRAEERHAHPGGELPAQHRGLGEAVLGEGTAGQDAPRPDRPARRAIHRLVLRVDLEVGERSACSRMGRAVSAPCGRCRVPAGRARLDVGLHLARLPLRPARRADFGASRGRHQPAGCGSASVSPHLGLRGLGLAARDVHALPEGGPEVALQKLVLRPAWSSSWLTGTPALHIDLTSEIGTGSVTVLLGESVRWQGEFRSVQIAPLLVGTLQDGFDLTGTLAADVDPGGCERPRKVAGWSATSASTFTMARSPDRGCPSRCPSRASGATSASTTTRPSAWKL